MSAKQAVPSTQRYLNIAQIQNGIVITKTGLLRRIIKVEPVNFALKSEQDQNVIIGQYQNFLNSLTFPTQIVIQSRRLDIAPYIGHLEKAMGEITNELLRFHTEEYIRFIQNLNDITNIMDKHFYVVIGLEPAALSKTGLFGGLFGRKEQHKITFSAKEWEKHTAELEQRVQLIVNGLNALGLNPKPLDTQESIELFYGVFNPEEAVTEKLTKTEDLQAPVISVDKETLAKTIPIEPNTTQVKNAAQGLNEAPAEQPVPAPPVTSTATPTIENPTQPPASPQPPQGINNGQTNQQ